MGWSLRLMGHLDRRQSNRDYDDRRGSARQRGYTTKWDKARATFLRDHPLCRMCLAECPSIVRAATVVDHIVPHQGDQVLFWDTDNWQALCKHHHDKHKQRDERGRVQAVGDDGWPL